MKKFNHNQIFTVFYIIDAILLLLLIISFTPIVKGKKEVTKQSAILNPKNVEKVTKIQISKYVEGSQEIIDLTKIGDFWIGTDNENQVFWPADNQIVSNLVENSSKIYKMNKKSDSKSSHSSYYLKENQGTLITFFDYSGNELSSVYFGLSDDFTSKIAFRSEKNNQVWQVEDKFSSFLTTDISFWCDPYIFIEGVLSKDEFKSSKNSLLRRGKVHNIQLESYGKPTSTYEERFGNGNRALYSFYKIEDVYFVRVAFISDINASSAQKEFLSKINYNYSISEWTFNRLTGKK